MNPIIRNQAVLLITSGQRSAADLTRYSGIDPDREWTRGEPRGANPGHGFYDLSGIEYRSRVSRSLPPSDHVSDLADRLASALPSLKRLSGDLVNEPDGKGVLRCYVYHETNELMTGFDLTATALRPFINIGSLIGISVSVIDDDDGSDRIGTTLSEP